MASENTWKQSISDDTDEEDDIKIIQEDSDSSPEYEKTVQNTAIKPLAKISVLVPVDDDTEMWWNKLKEVVREEEQCKIDNCQFAPAGHRLHPLFHRAYTIREIKLIIQYLIYYDVIHNGKGLRVWEEMHSRGYMQHRTVQSLNNNFKKILLRDIKIFKLPKKLEEKFLSLKA